MSENKILTPQEAAKLNKAGLEKAYADLYDHKVTISAPEAELQAKVVELQEEIAKLQAGKSSKSEDVLEQEIASLKALVEEQNKVIGKLQLDAESINATRPTLKYDGDEYTINFQRFKQKGVVYTAADLQKPENKALVAELIEQKSGVLTLKES